MEIKYLRPWAAVLALVLAACAGDAEGKKPSAVAGPSSGAKRVDAAKAGTLTGRVVFEGPVPENPMVKMSGDPMCIKANSDGMTFEHYVVKDGGLDNVFVHVKDGLGNYYFDTPSEPVKLDQQGCRYVPHVVGVRVGQPVEVANSDETMHNVHALPDTNREFNFAQVVKGQKNVQTFTTAEVMVPLKCDLHGWMNAYIGVVDHPYFAVTTNGGKFELKDLPAGTYTVEAWHQKAGRLTQQVTIGEKESRDLSFTFKATTSSN
jgi:plastocyanin